MDQLWQQVYETTFTDHTTYGSNLRICVSATPDLVNVITDIRKYNGEIATKLGVGLFPDELSWVSDVCWSKRNVQRQFDYRKITLEFENNCMTVIVTKKDGREQIMYLSFAQLESLRGVQKEIESGVNEAIALTKR